MDPLKPQWGQTLRGLPKRLRRVNSPSCGRECHLSAECQHHWLPRSISANGSACADLIDSEVRVPINFFERSIGLEGINEDDSLSAQYPLSFLVRKAHDAGDDQFTFAIAMNIWEVDVQETVLVVDSVVV